MKISAKSSSSSYRQPTHITGMLLLLFFLCVHVCRCVICNYDGTYLCCSPLNSCEAFKSFRAVEYVGMWVEQAKLVHRLLSAQKYQIRLSKTAWDIESPDSVSNAQHSTYYHRADANLYLLVSFRSSSSLFSISPFTIPNSTLSFYIEPIWSQYKPIQSRLLPLIHGWNRGKTPKSHHNQIENSKERDALVWENSLRDTPA